MAGRVERLPLGFDRGGAESDRPGQLGPGLAGARGGGRAATEGGSASARLGSRPEIRRTAASPAGGRVLDAAIATSSGAIRW